MLLLNLLIYILNRWKYFCFSHKTKGRKFFFYIDCYAIESIFIKFQVLWAFEFKFDMISKIHPFPTKESYHTRGNFWGAKSKFDMSFELHHFVKKN